MSQTLETNLSTTKCSPFSHKLLFKTLSNNRYSPHKPKLYSANQLSHSTLNQQSTSPTFFDENPSLCVPEAWPMATHGEILDEKRHHFLKGESNHNMWFQFAYHNICIHNIYIYVCMYVWMYECMNVWMYECMNVWMYVCMYECMNVWMYECMNVWMYECMNVCMYVCIYL